MGLRISAALQGSGRSGLHRSAATVFGLFVCLGLPGYAEAPATSSKRRAKTRFVKVTVKDLAGNPVTGASITVLDHATKRPLPGQKYSVDANGSKGLVVRVSPDVELLVTAPGKGHKSQIVYWANQYDFKLGQPTAQLPPLKFTTPATTPATTPVVVPVVVRKKTSVSIVVENPEGQRLKDAQVSVIDSKTKKIYDRKYLANGLGSVEFEAGDSTTISIVASAPGRDSVTQELGDKTAMVFKLKGPPPPPPVVTRKMRSVSVVVENPEGQRLKDAQVAVIDSQTKKIYERKFLVDGLGTVEFEADDSATFAVIASVPGRTPVTQELGSKTSMVFKLERRKETAKLKVTVKDNLGRQLAGATLVATESGRELTKVSTDEKGWAEVSFTYSDASSLIIEAHHGGYQPRKSPIRPSRDQSLEIVLMPARPVVKSSLVTVLVISKAFTSSPKTFARVRESVARVLRECAQKRELWKNTALLVIGDGRIRELLPLTEELTDADIKKAQERLSGLYAQAGTLSWRDLVKLAQFVGNSGQLGTAGGDLLVLAPKNMALDETLSLYDAGGDSAMDSFRQKNLRLRLVEIGYTDDSTRSYRELCQKTRGFYKSIKISDKLPDHIARLQFHFPTPPPLAETPRK